MAFPVKLDFRFGLLAFALLFFSIKGIGANKSLVDEVFSKYKSAKMVKLNVSKKVKSDIMGKTQVFVGEIFLAQKLFRWDTETPDKSQIIFDGTDVWNIQYPPKEMKSNPNIAKMKLNETSRKQILVSTLLNQEAVSKNFVVTDQNKTETTSEIGLEPKINDMKIRNLKVTIDTKKKNLSMISYEDDLGNQIEIEITKTTFVKSVNSKFFVYKPPAGISVTEL